MNPKLCELKEYTYRKGMQLICTLTACEKNNDGICKEFKEEK